MDKQSRCWYCRPGPWVLGLCASLVLFWACGTARALPCQKPRDPLSVQSRGMTVGTALLVELYRQLPERQEEDDPREWLARMQNALSGFQKKVSDCYTEGTLQRLLGCPDADARRAAVLALGLMGTMKSSPSLAGRLRDDDRRVKVMANDALWSIWLRGDNVADGTELQRLIGLRDRDKALAGLDALIRRSPGFAEAYNQRAILYFRMNEFERSVSDCEKVLQLNPNHYGALSGMGQAQMNLRRPSAALKSFRRAYQINPNLAGIEETIRALENALGEEGKPDDRK